MRVKYAFSLIRAFTVAELKVRYKGSVLGYLWSLLNPLLMLLTLYLVFSYIVQFDIEHYQVYLLLGIILWNFLSEATINSMQSLITRSGLIKKFNFPAESIIVSSCLAAFITFLLNLLVLFAFMIFLKVELSASIVILPIYLFELFIFVLGTSFLLSSLYVKYRDVNYLWSFLLLLGFFITPIVYPLNVIPFEYLRYYLLNPLARMVVDIRGILIYNYTPDLLNFLITFFVSLTILIFGYWIFRKRKNSFPEEI